MISTKNKLANINGNSNSGFSVRLNKINVSEPLKQRYGISAD